MWWLVFCCIKPRQGRVAASDAFENIADMGLKGVDFIRQRFGFCARLQEPRRFLQVVAGPRQVGKITLVRQALSLLDKLPGKAVAQHRVSADNPGLVGSSWLRSQWETARALAAQAGGCILVLDEVQKLPGWTEEVKQLWDEDTRAGRDVRVPAGCAGCKSMRVKWCASAAPARNYKCSTPP
jgi:hypothetical protein